VLFPKRLQRYTFFLILEVVTNLIYRYFKFFNLEHKTNSENMKLLLYLCAEKSRTMDYLPQDPAILVSSVNMLLRDEEFDTLEQLCFHFGKQPQEITDYLYGHGFVYSETQRQFRPIGYDKADDNER